MLDGPRVLGDAADPDVVAGRHQRARAVPRRLRHDRAGGQRRRRRPGAEPARQAGEAAPTSSRCRSSPSSGSSTYRWPAYGGVETPTLELPAHTTIEFHVTSLDVIHSFWAYQLGVKADANPGVDNVAYVTTKSPMTFEVHCAELCGVWHGYMYDTGARRAPDRSSPAGSPSRRSCTRRRPSRCRRTPCSTSRNPRGGADDRDHDARRPTPRMARPARLQPVDRDRAGGGRRADRRPRSARRSTRRASATTAPRPGRTTSRCCSPTCSGRSASSSGSASPTTRSAGCSATRRRSPSTSPRARGSAATSACAPTTRWSRSSTSSASGSSS